MKTMKRMLTVLLLIFLSNALFAQGFGIRAGVNFQNINGKDFNGDQLENTLVTGFHAGVNYEIPVGTDLYFQPGLLFSTKGGDIESVVNVVNTNEELLVTKLALSYIELPLNFMFKPMLGNGHMLLGFGPYLAYAIGGKGTEIDYDLEFESELTDDWDANGPIYIKPFDAGANFIVGYELANMLSLQLNAQLGLVDIYPTYQNDNEISWKNTGYGLSLGYRF
jgi:hypothetical protein